MPEDDNSTQTNEGEVTPDKTPDTTSEQSAEAVGEELGEKPKEELWKPKIPDWFLQNNVKGSFSLAASITPMWWEDSPHIPVHEDITLGTEFTPPSIESNRENEPTTKTPYAWKFSWQDYVQLRDTTSSALAVRPIGYPLQEQSAILIKSETPGVSESVDAAVARLAIENGATLISFDLGDLQDVAWDFDLQHAERRRLGLPMPKIDSYLTIPSLADVSLAELVIWYHFAALSYSSSYKATWDCDGPVPKPTEILLDAKKYQVKQQLDKSEGEVPESGSDIGPIFIHIRDATELLKVKDGFDCIENFTKVVCERRGKGEKILLFVSTSAKSEENDEDDEDDEEPTWQKSLREKLKIRAESVLSLVTTCVEDKEHQKQRERAKYASNIRRTLRQVVPPELLVGCEDLLGHYPKIDFGCHQDLAPILKGATLSDENAQRTSRQLCGRLVRNKTLTIDDIRSVLETVHKKPPEKELTAEQRFQKKLKALKEDCNQYEKIMLPCVVDTSQLETTYDDVVLENDTKETVKQLIALSQLGTQSHPLLRQVQMKGALFYGPPGTGKTHLTRAIARECGASMLAVDAGKLLNQWVGETEKNILALFTLCRKLHPCILFVDEADSLFYKRTCRDPSWRRNDITLFLQQMDGLVADDKTPFVIVATNRPSDLDEAFLRRLPYKALFTLPTEKERKSILRLFLKDEDIEDPIIIEQLARKTEGYSGADIKSLCGQAALAWSVEQSQNPSPGEEGQAPKLLLTAQHFTKALRRSRPAATRETKKMNEDFQREVTVRV